METTIEKIQNELKEEIVKSINIKIIDVKINFLINKIAELEDKIESLERFNYSE